MNKSKELKERPQDTRRLFYKIAETLRQQILSGDYASGDRLPAELKLAQTYGVSRPVMREAILVLEIQGYVEARVGAGVFVLDIPEDKEDPQSFEDIGPFEIMQARQIIESEAAALAAVRIGIKDLKEIRSILDASNALDEKQRRHTSRVELDRRFHTAIGEATNNAAVAESIKLLWAMRDGNKLWGRLNSHLEDTQQDWKAASKGHEKIYQALLERSPLKAKKAMAEHIHDIRAMLLDLTKFDDSTYDNLFFDDEIPFQWKD